MGLFRASGKNNKTNHANEHNVVKNSSRLFRSMTEELKHGLLTNNSSFVVRTELEPAISGALTTQLRCLCHVHCLKQCVGITIKRHYILITGTVEWDFYLDSTNSRMLIG